MDASDNDTDIVIPGRPDLGWNRDRRFGTTRAKKHPTYVYGTAQGLLLHKIAYIDLYWYRVSDGGGSLIRLKSPHQIIGTVCGTSFFGGKSPWRTRKSDERPRSTLCELPAPDAVLCGRCHGEEPTFRKGNTPGKSGITRREARKRIGCVVRVE